jgi:hypothetical protein
MTDLLFMLMFICLCLCLRLCLCLCSSSSATTTTTATHTITITAPAPAPATLSNFAHRPSPIYLSSSFFSSLSSTRPPQIPANRSEGGRVRARIVNRSREQGRNSQKSSSQGFRWTRVALCWLPDPLPRNRMGQGATGNSVFQGVPSLSVQARLGWAVGPAALGKVDLMMGGDLP